jgi:hypothetical protein
MQLAACMSCLLLQTDRQYWTRSGLIMKSDVSPGRSPPINSTARLRMIFGRSRWTWLDLLSSCYAQAESSQLVRASLLPEPQLATSTRRYCSYMHDVWTTMTSTLNWNRKDGCSSFFLGPEFSLLIADIISHNIIYIQDTIGNCIQDWICSHLALTS